MVDLSSPPLGDVHFGDSILSFLVEGEKVQDERHCMRVTSVLKFLWAGIASAASAIGEYGSGWRCPFPFYPLSFCENNNRKPSKNPITVFVVDYSSIAPTYSSTAVYRTNLRSVYCTHQRFVASFLM